MKYHPYLYIICASFLLTSCFSDDDAGFDTDGDGMLDKYDACPFDPNKFIEAGPCGCGNIENYVGDEVHCLYHIDGDSDQDGVIDSEDECPNKPFKYKPGVCGCDRYDFDNDNDGAIDACESLPGGTSVKTTQDYRSKASADVMIPTPTMMAPLTAPISAPMILTNNIPASADVARRMSMTMRTACPIASTVVPTILKNHTPASVDAETRIPSTPITTVLSTAWINVLMIQIKTIPLVFADAAYQMRI